MIQRIYGRDPTNSDLYLLRFKLTPKTRWGQLYFHVFYRGDMERELHDHPWGFWTIPLVTYEEDVLNLETREVNRNVVKRFRLYKRPATHTHRILDPNRKVFTLFWHMPKERDWGFWEKDVWVDHRDYLGLR